MQKTHFDNKQFKDLSLFACNSLLILPLKLICPSEIMFLGFVPNSLILLCNVGYVLALYLTSHTNFLLCILPLKVKRQEEVF